MNNNYDLISKVELSLADYKHQVPLAYGAYSLQAHCLYRGRLAYGNGLPDNNVGGNLQLNRWIFRVFEYITL